MRDNNLNEKHDFVFIHYTANQFDDIKVINYLIMQLHDLAHYVVVLCLLIFLWLLLPAEDIVRVLVLYLQVSRDA